MLPDNPTPLGAVRMGVETAVSPHGEWPGGSGVAHPVDGFPQEMGGAPGRVGSALTQPCHQHVAGARGDGEERVIAPLAGVVVALRTLLVQSKGVGDGGVQVDGQRIIARSGASGPGPSQHLSARPIQLAHVAPPETPQEGPQRGSRFDHTTQHLSDASAAWDGTIAYEPWVSIRMAAMRRAVFVKCWISSGFRLRSSTLRSRYDSHFLSTW